MRLFDVLGPVMIGPSSSHTAGAAKIGYTAQKLLGDIPVVGNLFKNKRRISNKSELLIFITPRVITDRGISR